MSGVCPVLGSVAGAIMLATAVLATLVPGALLAATIHVPGDRPDISSAIAFAVDGDVIVVAPGTYSGANNRNLHFYGKAITLRSSGGPSVTTITGSGADRVFHFMHGEGRDTLVEGFTISNGVAPTGENYGGGGLFFEEDSLGHPSSPTIRNCRIAYCGAHSGGGAYVLETCNPLFDSCSFYGNEAYGGDGFNQGGALYVDFTVQVWNSVFVDNHANFGGAVRIGPGITSNFLNCRFVANVARHGGAVAAFGDNGMRQRFANCLFKDNDAVSTIPGSSDGVGGAFYRAAAAECHFCTFVSNRAHNNQGHTAYSPVDGVSLVNSIVWDATSDSLVATGFDAHHTDFREAGLVGAPSNHNFSQDPEFVTGPGDYGSYYLSPISPCVDAGSLDAVDYCDIGAGPSVCLDWTSTRPDLAKDTGVADVGYHSFENPPLFADGFETGEFSHWS